MRQHTVISRNPLVLINKEPDKFKITITNCFNSYANTKSTIFVEVKRESYKKPFGPQKPNVFGNQDRCLLYCPGSEPSHVGNLNR